MSEPIDLEAVKKAIRESLLQVADNVAKHIIQRVGFSIHDRCFEFDLREAEERLLGIVLAADASKLLAEVERLRKELAIWKPLTTEEAEAALAEFENVPPLSEEEAQRIVEKVTDPAYTMPNPERIRLIADNKKLRAEVERLKESLDLACRKLQTYGSAVAERDREITRLSDALFRRADLLSRLEREIDDTDATADWELDDERWVQRLKERIAELTGLLRWTASGP